MGSKQIFFRVKKNFFYGSWLIETMVKIYNFTLAIILESMVFDHNFIFSILFFLYKKMYIYFFANLQNKFSKKIVKKNVVLGGGLEPVTPSTSVFHSPSLPPHLLWLKEKNMYINYNVSISMLIKGTQKKNSLTK